MKIKSAWEREDEGKVKLADLKPGDCFLHRFASGEGRDVVMMVLAHYDIRVQVFNLSDNETDSFGDGDIHVTPVDVEATWRKRGEV